MHEQKFFPSWYTIKSSNLVLLTFATIFFSRVIAAIGFPPIINFLHFGFVALLCGLTLPKTQIKIWNQISKKIFFGLFILLLIIVASAVLNSAGVINVILDFLLLGEPFVLLLAIISIRMSEKSIKQSRFWLMLFAFIHLVFVYIQHFILHVDAIGGPDEIKGVFLRQGAGHHVGGAVALTAGLYFFLTFRSLSIWLRTFVAVAFAANIVFADAKQVVVVFLLSIVVILLTKINNFGELLRYFLIASVAGIFVFWAAKIVFADSFSYWGNPDKFIPAIEVKFSVFPIITSYYHSLLNWLFGLGPGHTIGRLGSLIPDYIKYLKPLGVTSSPVTEAIFYENNTNSLSNAKTGSSMFSLMFSWAGIWGDLGFLGLGAYLYLWFLVWRQVCLDNLSKFFLITVWIFGVIFSWMEEPGYMLFVVSLIGLEWQGRQIKQKVILPKSHKKMQLVEKT